MASDRLQKFFLFDGLTLMILLPVAVLATLDAFWLFIIGWMSGLGPEAGYGSPPTFLDISLRILVVLAITFTSAYITRLHQSFERVRIGVVVSTLGVGTIVILLLQLFGLINIIPG
jgi:hypothetical protein